jgi:hypothetical protein
MGDEYRTGAHDKLEELSLCDVLLEWLPYGQWKSRAADR